MPVEYALYRTLAEEEFKDFPMIISEKNETIELQKNELLELEKSPLASNGLKCTIASSLIVVSRIILSIKMLP